MHRDGCLISIGICAIAWIMILWFFLEAFHPFGKGSGFFQ